MIYVIGIPLIAFAAILQSVIMNDIRMLNGRPDLALLILIAAALFFGIRPALILAFFAGLFLDLLSGLPLGLTSLELVTVLFMISFTENRFWHTNILVVEMVTLVSSFVFHTMAAGIQILTGSNILFTDALVRIVLPSTFLNMLFILPIAYAAYQIRLRTEEDQE
ncbi:MAG: rod shape-determining protein MreD [Anaerolineales bacterium]|nr:rod shape-determining protein MreD [Anaerolineales bacterium]